MNAIRIARLLVVLCVARASVSAQQATEHEGMDFQRARDAYFYGQRAYPFANVPAGAMERARLQMSLMTGPPAPTTAVTGTWFPIGPGGFFAADGYWNSGAPQTDAGRVDAIAFHPTDGTKMYLASPYGGVWMTSNTGASWSPLTDSQCSLVLGAVTLDPVNPSIVYAGLWNSAYPAINGSGCALLRSADGGQSWTSLGTSGFGYWTGGVHQIYVDPAMAGSTSGSRLLVAASFGLLKSTNSGTTVSYVMQSAEVFSIVAAPNTAGLLYAGVVNHSNSALSGVYQSTDNGNTWFQMGSGYPFSSASRVQLAVSAAEPNSVWAILGNATDQTFLDISKWDQSTQQWTGMAAAGVQQSNARLDFGKQAGYDLVLTVDPTDAKRMYIAGVRAFRSTDGGATFTPMADNIHCDWHALTIDPQNHLRLAAGTDGGVFLSTDGGETWVSRNNGLAITMYYPGISVHPSNSNIVLGGTQDNGSPIGNGTPIWSGVSDGDGGYTAMNPSNPAIQYTSCQFPVSPTSVCIYRRSPDVFANALQTRSAGISASDRGAFIAPLIMDPVTPTTLYFGTYRLYRTTNEGTLWAPISGDLTKGSPGVISTIAVAPSNDSVIYVGTSDGNVQVSLNAGTSFTPIISGLPNRYVSRLAVDAQNPQRVVVTFSGFNSATPAGHVFLTTNAGAAWTSISGNLPDVPTEVPVLMPGETNHYYVGTDFGVFESTDGGTTWARSPAGLPYVIVNDLVYSSSLKLLTAATNGRGMWQYSVNSAAVLRGDVNRDGAVNAADALLILQALVGTSLSSGLTPLPQGDANCNGTLETADALIVLRAAVGLTTAGACVGTIK